MGIQLTNSTSDDIDFGALSLGDVFTVVFWVKVSTITSFRGIWHTGAAQHSLYTDAAGELWCDLKTDGTNVSYKDGPAISAGTLVMIGIGVDFSDSGNIIEVWTASLASPPTKGTFSGSNSDGTGSAVDTTGNFFLGRGFAAASCYGGDYGPVVVDATRRWGARDFGLFWATGRPPLGGMAVWSEPGIYGSTTVATDWSGAGNDGTITGGALVQMSTRPPLTDFVHVEPTFGVPGSGSAFPFYRYYGGMV